MRARMAKIGALMLAMVAAGSGCSDQLTPMEPAAIGGWTAPSRAVLDITETVSLLKRNIPLTEDLVVSRTAGEEGRHDRDQGGGDQRVLPGRLASGERQGNDDHHRDGAEG